MNDVFHFPKRFKADGEVILVFSSVCVILSGGNRRSQGRRGASVTRGSRTRPGGSLVKFEGEFDFESSNAKFNKEEIEEELQQKLHDNLRITDEVNINNFGLNDCRLMSMDIVCFLPKFLLDISSVLLKDSNYFEKRSEKSV